MRQTSKSRQRGAVAVVVGLTIVMLAGMVGLAIDGGHLYLTKTELQNASDACALAASYNLTGSPTITQAAFLEAAAAGQAIGTRNKVDFQGSNVASTDITVEFAESLAGSWIKATSSPSGASKYVRCTLQRTGITPYLMQVMGFGDQTVRASATATLSPSQSNCAIPMGLCTQPAGTAPSYGYTAGQWYGLDFKESGGGGVNYTGNFRWLDFDPNNTTPGCPGGGANEIACVMKGAGQCSLPAPITTSCPNTGSTTPPGCVGENGNVSKMEAAYNSRFGVYKTGGGNPNIDDSPPDFTGFSYDSTTWTLGHDAYGGTVSGVSNFKAARTSHLSTQSAFYSNPYQNSTPTQHTEHGADRRLVVVPIVDCSGFTGGGQYAPIRAYACVLMLDTYRKSGSDVISKFEYVGLSNTPGSPCASSGVTGDDSAQGPLVPSLVQ